MQNEDSKESEEKKNEKDFNLSLNYDDYRADTERALIFDKENVLSTIPFTT